MATETQPAVVITKHVSAPRAQVFDAWIKPELRRQWWRATPQMTCTHCEIDARQGGQYRIGMLKPADTGPDPQDGGGEYIVAGEFELIDPPNKLVFT